MEFSKYPAWDEIPYVDDRFPVNTIPQNPKTEQEKKKAELFQELIEETEEFQSKQFDGLSRMKKPFVEPIKK